MALWFILASRSWSAKLAYISRSWSLKVFLYLSPGLTVLSHAMMRGDKQGCCLPFYACLESRGICTASSRKFLADIQVFFCQAPLDKQLYLLKSILVLMPYGGTIPSLTPNSMPHYWIGLVPGLSPIPVLYYWALIPQLWVKNRILKYIFVETQIDILSAYALN